MKFFINSTIIGLAILLLSALIIASFKTEKHRTEIQNQKEIINNLTDELHTMEVMYLKCVGSVKVNQKSAYYSNGKIKFYSTK